VAVRVKDNRQHPNNFVFKAKNYQTSMPKKAHEKTVQSKLIIRLRRCTTLLELEGAFSAGTKGVSIATGVRTTSLFLFRAPFRFTIFHTTEIPFAHCSLKYLSKNLFVS
jgi:uncharacterized membrane-anchored protein YitT (DUF2179 family)